MLTTFTDVRRALEANEVVPCFQPVVELRTGQLAGFEVLARWKHPYYGLILPENFISLAEEHGLIGRLTLQILQKSFRVSGVLPRALFLAVNISATQLDSNLPREIRREARRHCFPLQQLTIEITESALVDNLERALEITAELRSMGCQLALDDFGTGFSSLRHLRALPFSKLKIDRSFIHAMMSERESRKIVASVVGLGHSLDMTTIAEGVETEEQAEVLLSLGCELAQGWLYGRPEPAERLEEMVSAPPRPLPLRFRADQASVALSGLDALPTQRLAQLQAIYDGAPVGLCFLDKKLRYVSVNKRLADMNGVPVSAHLGRRVQDVIPSTFRIVEPYLRRALRGEAIPKVEAPRPANMEGQTDRTVLLSYQPVLDEVRDVIGISIAVVDLTEL